MRIHYGKLIDRYVICGRYGCRRRQVMRVQGDHGIIRVIPREEDQSAAGRIWGGYLVAYVRVGSRWQYYARHSGFLFQWPSATLIDLHPSDRRYPIGLWPANREEEK